MPIVYSNMPTYNDLRREALQWRHVAELYLNARDMTIKAMEEHDAKWKAEIPGSYTSVEEALKYLQAKIAWRIETLNNLARTAPGYSEGWAMGLLQVLGEVITLRNMFPKKDSPTPTLPQTLPGRCAGERELNEVNQAV